MEFNVKCIKLTLFPLIFLLLTLTAGAQRPDHKLSAVINVFWDDSIPLHDDSLEFSMCKNDINTAYTSGNNLYTVKLTANKTKLIIPLSTSINYGRITYLNDVSRSKFYNQTLNYGNLFLFEAGDTITLHLSHHNDNLIFTGKNSNSYQCMNEINLIKNKIKNLTFYAYAKVENWVAAYSYLLSRRDSIYALQLNILNKYKTKIDTEIYNLIRLDCWAGCDQEVIEWCYKSFAVNSSKRTMAAGDLFIKCYESENAGISNDSSLLVKSYNYGDLMVSKEIGYVLWKKTANHTPVSFPNFEFSDLDSAIDIHFSRGSLKDKVRLLSYFKAQRYKKADFVDFIDKGIQQAGDNEFRTAIIAFKNANSPGMAAYPFKFYDQSGKMLTLNDFKGKTTVIDFWFTGCTGCIQMAACLKPVIAHYKSDPDIIFATVSIDRDKNLWLQSIREEKYSSNDEVNMLEGMNGQSEFMKHYNIQIFPTLLVISKESKTISTAPPDPIKSTAGFMDFIDKILH